MLIISSFIAPSAEDFRLYFPLQSHRVHSAYSLDSKGGQWQLYDLSGIKAEAANPALPQTLSHLNPQKTFTLHLVPYKQPALPFTSLPLQPQQCHQGQSPGKASVAVKFEIFSIVIDINTGKYRAEEREEETTLRLLRNLKLMLSKFRYIQREKS